MKGKMLLLLAGGAVTVLAAAMAISYLGDKAAGESVSFMPARNAELIHRGAYLAKLGDCAACHSIRGRPAFSGGLKMGTPIGAIYTTNITPDSTYGIGRFTFSDFDRALRYGVAEGPEGALVYLDNCAACHRPDGRGYDRVFPALAGNPVVEAKSPESVVSIILRGSTTPRTGATPAQFTMPGFARRLCDVEVLQVANFVRSSWGNRGTRVQLQDVAHLRPGSPQR